MFTKPSQVLAAISWIGFFALSWLMISKPVTRDWFSGTFLAIYFVIAVCASALSYDKKK